MDHGLLLKKLYETGIRNKLVKLIESYLTNRVQVVRINGVYSSTSKVTNGVPHGTVLGPILFLVFVNELPKMCAQLFPLLFADDANFLSVGSENSENVGSENSENVDSENVCTIISPTFCR